jgi:hypothetical protein
VTFLHAQYFSVWFKEITTETPGRRNEVKIQRFCVTISNFIIHILRKPVNFAAIDITELLLKQAPNNLI